MMAGRIVLFGATGYTGELTARALVRSGARPTLAGRSAHRVAALAAVLGQLDSATADAGRPGTVRALVERGDVLVSTVGPFTRFGQAAVAAAIDAGAHYVDCTGEPAFVRAVFERHGPAARRAGCGLLTAFGYDCVPGNVAGALALRDAGESAVTLDVGYFVGGPPGGTGVSAGTKASVAGLMLEPGFAWRGGRLVTERLGRRSREFAFDGRSRRAVSVGSSEHFALPRLHPGLRDVEVSVGWLGPMSRGVQAASLATMAVTRLPGAKTALGGVLARVLSGSTGGPDGESRARTTTRTIAVAADSAGRSLAEVALVGGNPYDFTAEILSWGACRAADGGLLGTGALGPVDGFGLDVVQAGVESAGFRVQPHPHRA